MSPSKMCLVEIAVSRLVRSSALALDGTPFLQEMKFHFSKETLWHHFSEDAC